MRLFGKMDDLKSLRESLDKIKIKLGIEENKYKEAIQELKNLGIEEDDIDDEIKKAKSQKEELDIKKSELEEEIEEKITEAESILRK